MPSEATTHRLQLRSEPDAVRTARRALLGLEPDLDPGLFYDISLCVSELVGSVIRNVPWAGSHTVELELSVSDTALAAAVTGSELVDAAPEWASGPEEDLGIYIISRLAHRWGVEPAENRIWLEFDLTPSSRTRTTAFGPERPR